MVLGRLVRAARLDAAAYREARADPGALTSGVALVALAGLARGVGAWHDTGAAGLATSTLVALLLWLAAGGGAALLGRYAAPNPPRPVVVLRTVALAAAPGLFLALSAIPFPDAFRTGLWVFVHVAIIAALVLAVREALDTDTLRALYVCLALFTFGVVVLLLVAIPLAKGPAL